MEAALALLRTEIRSLSLLGVIIPRADKVQLELTALQLKKQCLHPENGKKKKAPSWMAHGPGDHLRKLTGNPGFPEGQPCSDT